MPHKELRYVAKIVEVYGKKASITGVRMSPHTWRRTFAKMSLHHGLDVITLQYIMAREKLGKHYRS